MNLPPAGWISIATCILEGLALAAVLYSRRRPLNRIWPPRRHEGWAWRGMSLLFFASSVGLLLTGLLDQGSLPVPIWLRVAGVPVWLAGAVLSAGAFFHLGVNVSFGAGDELRTGGWYARTRNPQYLGCIIALVGWSAMTASLWTMLAALPAIVAVTAAPFAEEPHLLERHGRRYAVYMERTPRFFRIHPAGADREES